LCKSLSDKRLAIRSQGGENKVVKTWEQINREFMEEHHLIKTETPAADGYRMMRQQAAELEELLLSMGLDDPKAGKAEWEMEPPAIAPAENMTDRSRQPAEQEKAQKKSNTFKIG